MKKCKLWIAINQCHFWVGLLNCGTIDRYCFGSMATQSKPGTSYKFRIKMASSTVKFDDHLVSNVVYKRSRLKLLVRHYDTWYLLPLIPRFQFHFSWEIGLFTLPHVIKCGTLLITTKARPRWYIHALLHAELTIVDVATYIAIQIYRDGRYWTPSTSI